MYGLWTGIPEQNKSANKKSDHIPVHYNYIPWWAMGRGYPRGYIDPAEGRSPALGGTGPEGGAIRMGGGSGCGIMG